MRAEEVNYLADGSIMCNVHLLELATFFGTFQHLGVSANPSNVFGVISCLASLTCRCRNRDTDNSTMSNMLKAALSKSDRWCRLPRLYVAGLEDRRRYGQSLVGRHRVKRCLGLRSLKEDLCKSMYKR